MTRAEAWKKGVKWLNGLGEASRGVMVGGEGQVVEEAQLCAAERERPERAV